MTDRKNIPLDLVHLLPLLDEQLIKLLHSLSTEEWQRQTVAKKWKVKDVAAHLLDGNIRILSMLRDGYYGESFSGQSYQDLLDYLNGLNADWVKAMQRVSPAMMVLLHEATGKAYCDYYASIDPFGPSPFAVNWAGENESLNWMHIAREYTEKWLHQQQIREAVNRPGLMTKEFFYPFINTFMMALPYTFREVEAATGTAVAITVSSEIGGSWFVCKEADGWKRYTTCAKEPAAHVEIAPELAWKLFSKSIRPEEVKEQIKLSGDVPLAKVALSMVSVMA